MVLVLVIRKLTKRPISLKSMVLLEARLVAVGKKMLSMFRNLLRVRSFGNDPNQLKKNMIVRKSLVPLPKMPKLLVYGLGVSIIMVNGSLFNRCHRSRLLSRLVRMVPLLSVLTPPVGAVV